MHSGVNLNFAFGSSGLHGHLKNLSKILCLPLYEPIHLQVGSSVAGMRRLFNNHVDLVSPLDGRIIVQTVR